MLQISADSAMKFGPIRGSRPAPALTNHRKGTATMATPQICSVDGCCKSGSKRGWCGTHYARWRRTGSPTGSVPRYVLPDFCSVDGCETKPMAKGLCLRHYKRMARHGDPKGGRADNGECFSWLLDHGDYAGDECLKWPFGAMSDDRLYGCATWPNGKQESAARIMCRLANGDPQDGENVARHLCGKGHEGCINPRHLAWGSYTENSADMIDHGTRLRGEGVGGAKLTSDDVLKIRRLSGTVSQGCLAKRFGVSQPAISAIQNKERWAWL